MSNIKTWLSRLEVKPINTADEIECAMRAEIDELRVALQASERVQQQHARTVMRQAGRIAKLIDDNSRLRTALEISTLGANQILLGLCKENTKLHEAAITVIDRGDTPHWKAVPVTAAEIG